MGGDFSKELIGRIEKLHAASRIDHREIGCLADEARVFAKVDQRLAPFGTYCGFGLVAQVQLGQATLHVFELVDQLRVKHIGLRFGQVARRGLLEQHSDLELRNSKLGHHRGGRLQRLQVPLQDLGFVLVRGRMGGKLDPADADQHDCQQGHGDGHDGKQGVANLQFQHG